MNKLFLTLVLPIILLSSIFANALCLISNTQIARAQSTPAWQNLQGVLAGSPVVARNADGRVEVFAVAPNHILYHISQDSPNGGFVGNWQPISGISVNGDPVIASNANGRLEIFARGMDNHLYSIFAHQSGQTTKSETSSQQQRQQLSVTSNNNSNNNIIPKSTGIPWLFR